MEFVGQAVPDGNAGVLCQLFDDILAEAAVLDTVIEPAEDARGVGDVLFVAELDVVLSEVFGVSALVYGGDGKGAACAGRRLLEDERDGLALKKVSDASVPYLGIGVLKEPVRCEVKEVIDLFGRVVLKRDEMTVAKIYRHR